MVIFHSYVSLPEGMVAQDAKNQPKIGLEHLKKTNRIRI